MALYTRGLEQTMPSDDGSDLVTAIATEVAKQVPVGDILKPAANEIGALGADLVKCVRLALAPVQYFAVQQDRYRRFIEASAQRVPLHRRVQPVPQLLDPILEGIRYEPEGTMTDEAFSELLSRAFDRERINQAHPAFPAIIRGLSDDEFELMKRLRNGPIDVDYGHNDDGFALIEDVAASELEAQFPYLLSGSQILAAATHLESEGLLFDLQPSPKGTFTEGPYKGKNRYAWTMRLSALGLLFAAATLSSIEGQT